MELIFGSEEAQKTWSARRGQSLSGVHLHHPGALHDEEGVVLPRG